MPEMPYSGKWQRTLSESFGREAATRLIHTANHHYFDLISQYPRKDYSSHHAELRSRILPGLAIYQTLLEELQDQAKALDQAELLFRSAFFAGRSRGIRLLNWMQNPFVIIRPALKLMSRKNYLPGSQEIVEDTPDCFAVNVYRCFILDVLKANQAAELTPLFCKTDDWLAEQLPKIKWERTQTLGRGGELCDFRWSRK